MPRPRRVSRRVARTLTASPVGILVALTMIATVVVSGCQSKAAVNREGHTGSGSASPVNGIQQITLKAGDDYRFSPSTITVHPGKVRVVLINTGSAPHNWQLTGFPVASVPLAAGGVTESVQFTAPAPGKYRFVCTIHEAQGQTGTLVVLGN